MDLTATLLELSEGLRKKVFSARELTEEYLRAIAERDGAVHAFLSVAADAARQQAQEVDARIAAGDTIPLLAGMPLAIKDVIATQGLPTTAGSKILEGYVPPYSATVVERLLAQQAILLGKTNCDEFAMGASGEYSAFGPTNNPWDHARVPGGSSSGSAAAVAAGMCAASLGSDTGGSVRQPASFCNLTGLKPTYGRVSRYGLIALASSFDQIGVLTRSAEDAAVLLQAIAGVDPRDATSATDAVPDFPALLQAPETDVRIGVPRALIAEGVAPEILERLRDAEAVLRELGYELVDVALPAAAAALSVYYLILPTEASANLARFDGVRFGPNSAGAPSMTFADAVSAFRAFRFGDEVKRRIMLGVFASSRGYQERFYRRAAKVRVVLRREFHDVLQDVSAILLPTSPDLPFCLGEKLRDPLALYVSDLFTVPANVTGLPALSFPAGFARGAGERRLPVGLQLIGRPFAEGHLLRIVHRYQGATAWHRERAPA